MEKIYNPNPRRRVHFISILFKNNAGMNFPICYANAPLLDLDKCRLPLTALREEVTCRHCLRLLARDVQWWRVQ